MTHRALQIVDAVKAELIAASAVPGAVSMSVYRQRTDDLDVSQLELPAACLMFSQDVPFSDLGNTNLAFIDSLLTLQIVIVAEGGPQDSVIESLMAMRVQVHKAVMADVTQGLAFVIATRYGGVDAPTFSTDGDRDSGALISVWHIHYRMNIFDPS